MFHHSQPDTPGIAFNSQRDGCCGVLVASQSQFGLDLQHRPFFAIATIFNGRSGCDCTLFVLAGAEQFLTFRQRFRLNCE